MRHWISCAVAALALAGCGAVDTMSAASGTPTAQDAGASDKAAADSGGAAHYGSADAATGSGGTMSMDAGTAAPPQGPNAAAGDQALGLKPGGAQDIAFFRMLVAAKTLPKAADMTIEGWLNEHDTALPAALKDRAVTLHALAALVQPSAGSASDAVLQLGLNSGKSLADVTDKVALTLVIDRSGSMAGEKINYVKAGLHTLVAHLPKDALVSLVSFSSGVTTDVQPAVSGEGQKAALDAAIDALQADGGTNFYGGLETGGKLCKGASSDYKFRHVLMLSDGVPTEGFTGKGEIEWLAGSVAKSGCTVSTVGVGFDFDPQLMTHVAQNGNGTGWFVQDAAHAQEVFVQDLETMLLPVAEKLTLAFELAQGWKVSEIYGFDWVEKNGIVEITGAKKPATDPTTQPVDPGTTTPGGGETVAMPTLYASKRNGMVMVRLQAPAGADLSLVKDLQIATVKYGYTLSKQQTPEQFSVPVQVPGLYTIPDAGLQYFASPIVHRAWLLLHTGLDLMDACKLGEANQPEAAAAVLKAAIARIDAHLAQFSAAQLALVDISTPDLKDARQLLVAVQTLLATSVPQP